MLVKYSKLNTQCNEKFRVREIVDKARAGQWYKKAFVITIGIRILEKYFLTKPN